MGILDFSIAPNDPNNPAAGYNYDSRQALANEMLKQGTNYSPVQSPWQGAARMAQALLGGYQENQLAKQRQAADAPLASLFGASSTTPAVAPPAGGPAAAPLPAGMSPGSSAPSAGQDAILQQSNASLPASPVLAQARSPYAAELQDPAVATKLAAVTHAEVGSQGPQAQQAFVESVLNRAAARGQSLKDTLSGSYFPQQTYDRAATYAQNPAITSQYAPIIGSALNGSNVSNYATGNASGTVGFAGGPQTYAANGERFGVEGPDQKWAANVQSSPGVAAINANMPQASTGPSAPPPSASAFAAPDASTNAVPPAQSPRAAMMASMLQNGVPAGTPAGPSPQALVNGLTGNSGPTPSAPSQAANPQAAMMSVMLNPAASPQARQMAGMMLQTQMQPKFDFVTRPDGSVVAVNKFNPTQSVQAAGPMKTDSIIEGPMDPNTGIAPKLVWNPVDGVKGVMGPNGQVMPPGQLAGQGAQPQQAPQSPNMPSAVSSAPLPPIGTQPTAPTPAPAQSAAQSQGTLGANLVPPSPTSAAPSPGIGGIPTPQGVNIPEYIKKRGELAANESMPSASDELGFSQKLMERPSYKEYSAAIPTFNSFTQHIHDNSPAADKAIVDDFAKILNPGRSVTTGAFQLNMDAQSIPDQLKAEVMKAYTGDGELGPDARAQMARIAELKMHEYKTAWDTDSGQAKSILQNHHGYNPNVIPSLPDMKPIDYSKINTVKTTAAGADQPIDPDAPTPIKPAASIPTVTTPADYAAIPSGAQFTDAQGNVRVKR